MNREWELYTDDDGFSGVKIDDTHFVGWDLEGWDDCCESYMNLIAAAPNLLEACGYGNIQNEKGNVLDYAANLIESMLERDNSGNWEVARTLRMKAEKEREAIAKAYGNLT
jgi:hypothetical protein